MLHNNRRVEDKKIVPFCMPILKVKERAGSLPVEDVNTEHIEKEAYEKAFESGEQAGFAMGEKKALVLVEKLENLIDDLAGIRKTVAKEVELQVVELAVGVARKILLKEISINPEQILEMTKEALSRVERTGRITIKINPSLNDLFMRHRPDMLSKYPDIVFDVDPSVSGSGSVVMGPAEDIVTDVDVQLKHLIKEMGERLNGD